MEKFPCDSKARKIGSRARAIVHYKINSGCWDYREETGNDVGRDCTIELSINNKWENRKIECQIKGTESIKRYETAQKEELSFPLEIKTISYALNATVPFLLFLVDVKTENVYYLPLQEYFIKNKEEIKKLEKNDKTVNVHILKKSLLTHDDNDLRELTQYTYIGGATENLNKIKTN